MVDPTHHWATYFYAVLISIMFTSALGGFLPPKRDIRIAIGSLVIFISWLVSLQAQRLFGFWNATSYLFLADSLWAYIFYLISRPWKADTEIVIHDRNWAGWVSILHIGIVILQLSHIGITHQHFSSFGYLVGAILVVSGWILYRAFGLRWAALFTLGATIMVIAAIYKFSWALNILFGLSVLIVTLRGIKVSKANIQSWRQSHL